MEDLTQTQEILVAKLNQAIKNFKKTGSARRTKSYLQNRMSEARVIWDQFNSNDIQILTLATTADKAKFDYFLAEVFSSTDEIYFNYISDLGDLIEIFDKPAPLDISSPGNESVSIPNPYKQLGLPKINIPKFDGNFENWQSFNDLFISLVHTRNDVPAVNKLHYLKTSLIGEAEQLLKHFSVTEANYQVAWELLNKRFNNKRVLITKHLNRFLNHPAIFSETAHKLKELLDVIRETMSSLKHLGVSTTSWDVIIIHLVVQKFPRATIQLWEQSLNTSNDIPSYDELIRFLECRYRTLELIDNSCTMLPAKKFGNSNQNNKDDKAKGKSNPFERNRNNFAFSVSEPTKNSNSCAFCKLIGHNIHKCLKFSELSVMERYNRVKALSLCLNCLEKGHSVKSCKSVHCKVCLSPHHTLLHRYPLNSSSSTGNNSAVSLPVVAASNMDVNSLLASSFQGSSVFKNSEGKKALLATAVVQIKDRNGIFKPIRALLDSGSELSFISETMVQYLGLKKHKIYSNVKGIGNSNTKIRYETSSAVKSRVNDFSVNLSLLVLPTITGILPDTQLPVEGWNIPKNIELADPFFFQSQKIDLLIGAEVFFDLLSVGQIKLGSDLPLLQKTLLGWIVSGKYAYQSPQPKPCNISLSSCSKSDKSDLPLDELVQKFWQLEHFAENSLNLTQEQLICEDLFSKNVRRNIDGRVIVKLPFKDSISDLGNSRFTAERRFSSLERKLRKDTIIKDMYCKFLKEYESLDHMELVPRNREHLIKYYLPHHSVIKPDSSTTKLRVVFDGSCKTTSNISLNNTLMVGPIVQDDLFSILIRFRCYRYALKADISKMYRQILVNESDSNYQCILWRDDPAQDIRAYRLKTVTYGTAAASYLPTKSLIYLASVYSKDFSTGSQIISKDFYVDDLLTGGNSYEDIEKIKFEVDAILKSGGMELKKWYSNNTIFLDSIPITDRETLISVDGSSIIKTLGTSWQPYSDDFKFIVSPEFFENKPITKRNVLSDLARLFDPLGLINPLVVKAKIFMQKLWLLKLDWDESLPIGLHTEWEMFKQELQHFNKISLPRYALCQNYKSIEIHGFSDASLRAYGCCIYLRCIDTHGDIYVNLFTAKSRVAPSSTQSMPRLELCAALLLANLVHKVRQTTNLKYDEIFLWTDSEIVLDWLSAHSSSWNIFVANRVSKIQELTKDIKWRHVTSKDNAADLLSRGASVEELLKSTWYSGPNFLRKSPEFWPVTKIRNSNSDTPEKRIKTLYSLVSFKPAYVDLYDLINRFSNYTKIVNIFAYVIRFCKNCKPQVAQNRIVDVISPEESQYALLKIVELIQHTAFEAEISCLMKGQLISSKSSIKSPFMEQENNINLLKVGGRLHNSNLPYSAKCPVLLPAKDRFVNLLINHLHIKNLHAGPQALLAIIRQRFWVINGRAVMSSIVNKCIHCFHYKPKLMQQIMGNLPENRVQFSRPFHITGVDFCGPVLISPGFRGKQLYKAYIAVFVCFSTHAVHLELVSSLTTDSFIITLKRFIARRGLCFQLHCDNATNFVGARSKLEDLRRKFQDQQFKNCIASWCSSQGIHFRHIPARSPHFGGIWEAAVKSAKKHLNRSLQDTRLTFEEMSTLLAQIEAILNSRPLAPLSSDPSDEGELTPGHFLIGLPMNAFPEPQLGSHLNITQIQKFNRISFLQQHFWKRWSNEYLLNLQQRYKWKNPVQNIEVGMLVLIGEDNTPPQQWPLGRITAIYPGRDNKVRVADIRSRGKIIRRQIHSLAPLPIEVAAT